MDVWLCVLKVVLCLHCQYDKRTKTVTYAKIQLLNCLVPPLWQICTTRRCSGSPRFFISERVAYLYGKLLLGNVKEIVTKTRFV